MDIKIRVRYAPSPTGFQHIGSMRTFLFDYFYAKATNGTFILRIEDTDQTRSFEGAMEDIYETFKWLGIDYDEGPVKGGKFGPYIQSERKERYKKYAEELVKNGHAYYCFCDSGRLEEMRQTQEKNKETNVGYDRHCRNLDKIEIEKLLQTGKPYVIRFKTPVEGKTILDDIIFKKIEFENKLLQDIVLLKTDGFPTYHLANVVDDNLMEITHVLRGQEWIPTSPYHVMLYKTFGWNVPKFCHLPLIVGEDGQKLSKRHGATQVREFKKQGYLPEALINFVMLLGWSYNDSQELFSSEELKKVFSLERINKASAVFNYGKLKWFNGQYIRKKSIDELSNLILPYYIDKGLISKQSTNGELDYLKKIIPLIQERMELLTDAPLISDFMFGDLPEYKTWEAIFPKNVEKNIVIKILSDAKEVLKNFNKKDHEELHKELYDIAAKYNVKAGAVFMPIRIAVTGINKSPELFPVMEVLGIDRVLLRIENAIKRLKSE